MQFISPTGESDGFIETFVHEHNGTAYYGARYYNAQRQFVKEDLFLSRVVS